MLYDRKPGMISRRRFLQAMGTTLAALQAGGCKRAPEHIVPYVKNPEHLVPGVPKFYATIITAASAARGVFAESHMGRPTRLQGNPHHPESMGALDCISQAAIYSLYGTERSKEVRQGDASSSLEEFYRFLAELRKTFSASRGQGLRILTGNVISPCLAGLLSRVVSEFPSAQWHQFDPISAENLYEGTTLAFGESLTPLYDFSKADVVLSVGGDFLGSMRGSLRYARDFIARRKNPANMPILFMAEAGISLTGARADTRLAVHPSEISAIAECLALKFAVLPVASSRAMTPSTTAFCDQVERALKTAGAGAIVVPGEFEDPYVQALCHGINSALGSIGAGCSYIPPLELRQVNNTGSLSQLVSDMEAGKVDVLITFHSNPCHTAPADIDFRTALAKVKSSIHMGLYYDETGRASSWHIPEAHELESWGDGRAFDGTISLQQPLIDPLFNGKTPLELVALLLDDKRDAHSLLRDYWKEASQAADFDEWWLRTLQEGVVEGSAAKPVPVRFQGGALAATARAAPMRPPGAATDALTLVVCPDSRLWDGRFAENTWLQELPDPITKITWDNAVCISPQTAKDLHLSIGQEVEIRADERLCIAGVMVVPGLAPNVAQISLGHGRAVVGEGRTAGSGNVYLLRTSAALWVIPSIQFAATDTTRVFARAQLQYSAHDRDLVRVVSSKQISEAEAPQEGHTSLSLYPDAPREGNQWGMAIDLNACIGCQACVIACQAENNIPSVGKEEVARGRRMHWLRVDRYAEGDDENARYYFQPIPCMHCEYAPCELVCPVAATVHSPDGLNEQVYNRCVGTRYCSNNCPYKVRRFNFYSYNDHVTPLLAMLKNPDVTVRSRGVMEKCTYCVQRISAGRISAEREKRRLRDGEVQTACQESCPTRAIVFGDVSDPDSEVSKLKKRNGNYGLLVELNTRPRTTYLPYIVPSNRTES